MAPIMVKGFLTILIITFYCLHKSLTKQLFVSSSNGHNSSICGTIQRPCKTINDVITKTEANDVIYLYGSQPYANLTINQPLRFESTNGQFVLDSSVIKINNSRTIDLNITFFNIRFVNSSLILEDSSVLMVNCDIRDSRNYFLRIFYTKDMKVQRHISIKGSHFTNNLGCLHIEDNNEKTFPLKTNIEIVECNFVNNSFVNSNNSEGIINMTASSTLRIEHCSFSSNYGKRGAIINAVTKQIGILVFDSVFNDNSFQSDSLISVTYTDKDNSNNSYSNIILQGNLFVDNMGATVKMKCLKCYVKILQIQAINYKSTMGLFLDIKSIVRINVRLWKCLIQGLTSRNIIRIEAADSLSEFKIEQSSFLKNFFSIIHLEGKIAENISISDSEFNSALPFGNGGCLNLVFQEVRNIILHNVTFINCRSHYFGGSICVAVSLLQSFIVINSFFSGSFTSYYGGGIALIGSLQNPSKNKLEPAVNNIELINTVFKDCSSPSGSCVYISFKILVGSFALINTSLIDNVQIPSGNFLAGAVFVSSDTVQSMTVLNSTFVNNRANIGSGGAIGIRAGYHLKVLVSNSLFVGNSAKRNGGAVSIVTKNGRSVIIFENNEFKDNLATFSKDIDQCKKDSVMGGGAVHIDSAEISTPEITLKNCVFEGNSGCNGGAVYVRFNESSQYAIAKATVNVLNVTCFHSEASIYGGCLFILSDTKTVVHFKKLISTSNSASYGATIALQNNKISSKNADIIQMTTEDLISSYNRATRNGGSLYFYCTMQVSVMILNSNFYKDITEREGGAIYVYNEGERPVSMTYENVYFRNLFGSSSSAIKILDKSRPSTQSSFVFMSCLFEDNVSLLDGILRGEFSVGTGMILITNTTFKRNICDDGVLNLMVRNVSIFDSVFENNMMSQYSVVGDITVEKTVTKEAVNVIIKGTKFMKAPLEKKLSSVTYRTESGFFVHFQNWNGYLRIENTEFDLSSFQSKKGRLLKVRTNRTDIYESTHFICPQATEIEVETSIFEDAGFDKQVGGRGENIDLEFLCDTCRTDFYIAGPPRQSHGLNYDRNLDCQNCPHGAICGEDGLKVKSNFWGHLSPKTLNVTFHLCPPGYCCPAVYNSCHNYSHCHGNRTGILCGRCREGFTETLSSTFCSRIEMCEDYWIFPVYIIAAFTFALILIKKKNIILFLSAQLQKNSARAMVTKKTVLGGDFSGNNNERDEIETISEASNRNGDENDGESNDYEEGKVKSNPDSTNRVNDKNDEEDHDFDRSDGYLKILFYFYQGAGIIVTPTSLDLLFKGKIVLLLMDLFNFKLNISSSSGFCPFPGLTVVSKIVLEAFGSVSLLCAVYIIFLVECLLLKLHVRTIVDNASFVGAFMDVLLLSYASFTTAFFSLIGCVKIGEEKRLFFDGNVACFQWWQYNIMFILAIWAFPLMYVLYKGVQKLQRREISSKEFLLSWFLPLPFILKWKFQVNKIRAFETSKRTGGSENAIIEVVSGPFRKTRESTSEYVCWESILIGRKCLLILIHSILIDRPLLMSFLISVACLFFLIQHLKVEPYNSEVANRIEAMSLSLHMVLCLTTVGQAGLWSLGSRPEGFAAFLSEMFQWMQIIILTMVPCFLFVILFFWLLYLLARLTINSINSRQARV